MKTMTKERLAKLLNDNKVGSEITEGQERRAKDSGLLVMFMSLDSRLKMRGAIHDEMEDSDGYDYALILAGEKYTYVDEEIDCTASETVVLPLSDEYETDLNPRLIRTHSYSGDSQALKWHIESNMPCVPFLTIEDGAPYCQGIVINLNKIKCRKP